MIIFPIFSFFLTAKWSTGLPALLLSNVDIRCTVHQTGQFVGCSQYNKILSNKSLINSFLNNLLHVHHRDFKISFSAWRVRGWMWIYRVLREAPGASGWWELAPGPGRAQCWAERLGGETWHKCSVLKTRVSVRAKFAAKSKEKLLDRDTQRRSLADSRLPDLANQLVILLVNSKSSFGNKEEWSRNKLTLQKF